MTTRVSLESVFILHSRPYSNTSLLLELFSQQHGRIAALARSARGLKSRYRGKLQLFSPLLASWSGRTELMSLGDIEPNGLPYRLEGDALFCGFYLNELLIRLLHRDDPHPPIFSMYQVTLERLAALQTASELAIALRCFEKQLLEQLGYGLSLAYDAHSRQPIQADQMYQFIPERGFLLCAYNTQEDPVRVFSGNSLLSLHREQFDDELALQDAKRLMRISLSRYLGARPLKSRELLE